MTVGPRIDPSADVSAEADIGDGTSIWHLVQVREDAVIGTDCIVGRGSYIGAGVRIGNNVKIQNYALVYEPAVIGDGAFIGPAAILTNDVYPRSVAPDGAVKAADDWTSAGVNIGTGASVGARAVVVAGVTIGRWALVGAGAVVVKDVPDHALVVGNPARRIGWVGRSGVRLDREEDGSWLCPTTSERYRETDRGLMLDEPTSDSQQTS